MSGRKAGSSSIKALSPYKQPREKNDTGLQVVSSIGTKPRGKSLEPSVFQCMATHQQVPWLDKFMDLAGPRHGSVRTDAW